MLKEQVGSARIAAKTNDLKRARLADRTLQVILETRLTASGRSFVFCETKQVQFTRRSVAVKPFSEGELLMTATALTPRFVRRTQLGANEYRKNFRQIDGDVISAVTSAEADRVTPLMSKIYLRLVHAPAQYLERDGVLRFEGELRDDGHVTAWEALCEVVGVASATARKALRWMHEQGIIGYFAGKNGVGIRVFLNRAMSSIGTRAAGQKILEFPRASSQEPCASADEAAFSDSFADLEVSDTDLNPRAPKNGAEIESEREVNTPLNQHQQSAVQAAFRGTGRMIYGGTTLAPSFEEIARVLLVKIGPSIHAATASAIAREHERTREWLENRGLPKMTRVAQRETFNVLRKCGVINEGAGHSSAQARVGRSEGVVGRPHPLSHEEVGELAQACVAMLEVQGQAIERTLSEMSSEAGGFLLPEDAPRVREKAASILQASQRKTGREETDV